MAAWQTLVFFSGLLAVSIFARSAVLAALLMMIPFAVLSLQTGGRPRLGFVHGLLFTIPMVAWIALSAAWSSDVLNTFLKFALLLLLIVSLGIVLLDCKAMALPLLVVIGLAGTVAVSALETLSDQALYRYSLVQMPSLGANIQRQLSFSDGKLVSVGVAELSRRTAIACLLIVPTFIAVFGVAADSVFRILFCGVSFSVGVLIFSTAHQSSQFAIVAGLIILASGWISRSLVHRLVTLGWIVAVLLILPIAASGTALGLHKVSWLPDSAKHRIIIWDYIADQYTQKPILGIGAGATEAVHATKRAEIEAHQKALGPWLVGITHAHNAYLEIWYELGIVGAVLLLVAGLTLLRRIAALPHPISLIWQVQFTVIATQIAFSYSIWQPWYQASIALSIFMTKLACDSLLSDKRSTPAPAAIQTGSS